MIVSHNFKYSFEFKKTRVLNDSRLENLENYKNFQCTFSDGFRWYNHFKVLWSVIFRIKSVFRQTRLKFKDLKFSITTLIKKLRNIKYLSYIFYFSSFNWNSISHSILFGRNENGSAHQSRSISFQRILLPLYVVQDLVARSYSTTKTRTRVFKFASSAY